MTNTFEPGRRYRWRHSTNANLMEVIAVGDPARPGANQAVLYRILEGPDRGRTFGGNLYLDDYTIAVPTYKVQLRSPFAGERYLDDSGNIGTATYTWTTDKVPVIIDEEW